MSRIINQQKEAKDNIVKINLRNTAISYGIHSVLGDDIEVLAQWTINQILSGNQAVKEHYNKVKKAGIIPVSQISEKKVKAYDYVNGAMVQSGYLDYSKELKFIPLKKGEEPEIIK